MGSLRVRHDWASSFSLFILMHWRRKWQPTPVFLPGESQERGSLVGCHLWDRTESNTTEATQQQQQAFFSSSFSPLPVLESPTFSGFYLGDTFPKVQKWYIWTTCLLFRSQVISEANCHLLTFLLPLVPHHGWGKRKLGSVKSFTSYN